MTIINALQEAKTVEDFIAAIADLGNPDTGSCEDWDDQDMRDTMEKIIECARRYQAPMEHSRSILLQGLQVDGPIDYTGPVTITNCGLCNGWGSHEHGKCVRCNGTGHIAVPDEGDKYENQGQEGATGG